MSSGGSGSSGYTIITWSTDKAGTLPGQKQSLEVEIQSRSINSIKVYYKFTTQSLDYDSFYYDQRHNKVTIALSDSSKGVYGSEVFTYQLRKTTKEKTFSGTFTVSNIPNGMTELSVTYQNERIWVDAPSRSDLERSTGVWPKTTLGEISFPDNKKYTIKYDKGYKNGNISNIPKSQTRYQGSSFTIPSNILEDNSYHYVFTSKYTTEFPHAAVNILDDVTARGSDIYDCGTSITYYSLEGTKTFYAIWKPRAYLYRFFSDDKYTKEFSELANSYIYTKTPATLANLNELTNDNKNINSKYYKQGYEFSSWNSKKGNISINDLQCSIDSDVNFYAKYNPISSKIRFNYGFDSYIRDISYTYGNTLNFKSALKTKSNTDTTISMIRPGYTLIGWVFDKSISDKIYEPSKAPKVDFKATESSVVTYSKNISNFVFKNSGLTLYAVWEYSTSLYVYYNGKWRLAIPYVYTYSSKDKKSMWRTSLAYGYTLSKNPSWKL